MTNPLKTYDPEKFMPIYVEGKIANRNEFIAYKAKEAANAIVEALDKAYFAAGGQKGL